MPLLVSDRPRDHHYLFAHRELPAVVARFGEDMPAMVNAGRLDEALLQTWHHLGEHLPHDERVDPRGLSSSVHAIPVGEIVLVTMPRAEHITEAHFAAVVVLPEHRPRYLVLEHSWTTEDAPATVVGEWTSERHLNLGEGPAADAEAFLTVVSDLCATR